MHKLLYEFKYQKIHVKIQNVPQECNFLHFQQAPFSCLEAFQINGHTFCFLCILFNDGRNFPSSESVCLLK